MTSVRPKLKADIPKVITAWDVATGATVYQTADRNWSENVADAEVVVGEAADAALEAAQGDELRILDPYVMEVTGRETLRETIRATGPTTHTEFHKAARGVVDA